jgi:hypothetical protein
MSLESLLGNLLYPPVMFFFLGVLAATLKSDLEIPPQMSKFLSIYLLFNIGIKGGLELQHSGLDGYILLLLLICVGLSFAVPLGVYPILRRRLNVPDAGAIAATYGSISAMIFTTGISFLETAGIPFNGYMVACMVLMESPAIVSGLVLIRRGLAKTRPQGLRPRRTRLRPILHEAFFNGSVFLLIGSLLIGYLSSPKAGEELKPFVTDIFKGMLSLYMLDMGLLAGRRLGELRKNGSFLVGYALAFPIVMGAVGIGLAYMLGLTPGNALLFTLLCASASFIAVPAAMRMAVPEANMSLLLPMSLGVTDTYLILVGIPLYHQIIQLLW